MTSPFNDRPIQRADEDEFSRASFARNLADALFNSTRAGGLVIAVEGEWGSGKTSVLNMVETHLHTKDPLPVVMRFDPWLISGSESLIESFLIQLAAELGQTPKLQEASKAAKRVLRFAKLLRPAKLVPGVEPWGTLIHKLVEVTESVVESTSSALGEFAVLDLKRRKAEVAEALKELGRPVIVVIDDIDRLEPGEIRQIFQLVKSVAGFEEVSYLLAYDPQPVHSALSFGGVYDGVTFAEKVVQVAYPLPQLGYWPLKRFLRNKLERFLKINEIELVAFEKDRLEEALSGMGRLTHALRHPRDVLRLANRLQVSAPATRGEVNFGDLVVFELLSLRFPLVANVIRRRPYDFVRNWQRHDEPMLLDYLAAADRVTGHGRPEIPAWKTQLWDSLDENERNILFNLLGFLFPGFRNEPLFGSGGDAQQELRLNQRDPLLKLLACGPVEGLFFGGRCTQLPEAA